MQSTVLQSNGRELREIVTLQIVRTKMLQRNHADTSGSAADVAIPRTLPTVVAVLKMSDDATVAGAVAKRQCEKNPFIILGVASNLKNNPCSTVAHVITEKLFFILHSCTFVMKEI